ncbi:MAG TPA: MarR family transcriptional regulator [Symbiobacteriaceae bacterium]|jgi:repressor LexA
MERQLLSKRQTDALAAIERFIQQHGWPPSQRELAALLGLTSASTVNGLLAVLEAKGWIERGGGPRELRIIPPQNAEGKVDDSGS